jgi:hypothetical protein
VNHIQQGDKLWKRLRAAGLCVSVALASVPLQAGAAPYSGTPAALPSTLEAENFDKGGEGVGYHDLTARNTGKQYRKSEGPDIIRSSDPAGGGYVVNNFQAGEWLAYTVNASASGSYKLALRAAANYSWMKPSFHIEVDGKNVTGSVPVPLTGSWSAFQWVDAPAINLSAGQHTIRVVADAQYFNLNQIRIDTGTATAPADPAPGESYPGTPYTGTPVPLPRVFEAENFDKGGEGVAYHDVVPGNAGGQYRTSESVDIVPSSDSAGGGYVVNNFETGEWMAYTVNVPANGKYDLSIRTASHYASPPAFHFEVDGVNVTGPITVPDTGGWDTFQWVGKTGVNLTAGTHVLKLVADAQYFDVNQISVQASATTTPTTPTSPTTGTPTVLWRAGMEAGNLSEWSDQVTSGSASSVAVTAASAGIPPKAGSWVMRQSVSGSGGTRMVRYGEIDSLVSAGTPFYVSWWDYYPTKISFPIFDYWNMWQVVSRDAGCAYHPIWILDLDGSNSTLKLIWSPNAKAPSEGPHAGESGKRVYTSSAVLPSAQWVFFEVMVKPASDFSGAIKVWLNGQPLFDQSNVKTRFPDGGCSGWMGINHNAYGTNLTPNPATHYVDDVTISLGRMPYAP